MTADILRIWRGRIRPADVAEYESYQRATALPHMAGIDGNRGLYFGHRRTGDIAEFATFSLWSSWDTVHAFAGNDVDRAVDLPDDERFLVNQWKTMENYEVFKSVPAGDPARIVRVWRGSTLASDGDAYEEYLGKTGFAEYAATAGNQGVFMPGAMSTAWHGSAASRSGSQWTPSAPSPAMIPSVRCSIPRTIGSSPSVS